MVGIAEYTDFDSFVVEYGDLDQWKELDGQKIGVAAATADIEFPTDVRLPVNEPKANKTELWD
jgi:hypothetical protein